MQHASGQPVPVNRIGAIPAAGVGAGPAPGNHRGGRPINGAGQAHGHAHHAGMRNRSNTTGSNMTNGGSQFEGARSPPGTKSEFPSAAANPKPRGHGGPRRKFTDRQAKDLQHVPCKFFRVGQCQAGNACPFSHEVDHGEQPCKYFAKGNCKFGPKCANLHVDQFGRVLNRREKNLSSYNLGGRNESLAYQQQQQGTPMGAPHDDFNGNHAPFTNQIPPISDLEGSVPIPQTKPYDIPGSTQFGSPQEDGRFPMSPPLLRNMNEVGLPSSFDSKGSSTFFKHGPIAASVPSKFFTNMQSPPSSIPRQSMLTSEAMRKIGEANKPKAGPFGSSPGFQMEDEPSAPRMLHSQQRHKSRAGGLISTSLPVQEEWEKDDETLFAEEEDYIPSELLNSQIRNKDDRFDANLGRNGGHATQTSISSTSAPRDFIRRSSFSSNGAAAVGPFGSPDLAPKWESPSLASPGNSRFMGLFADQKRNGDAGYGIVHGSSPFGPVGSPRRNSVFGTSPAPASGNISHAHSYSQSPPVPSSVSGITLGLKNIQFGSAAPTSSDGKTLKPIPAANPRRISDPRINNSRTVSSNSVSQRIDEEPQDFVFAMEADDLGSTPKEKMYEGPWGQATSPSFGPVGAGRKPSMTGKKPNAI